MPSTGKTRQPAFSGITPNRARRGHAKTARLTRLGHHWEHSTAYRDGAVYWAWVANLILLHNFKVFALKIKRGTLALLNQQ
jgi:hypothetical protein